MNYRFHRALVFALVVFTLVFEFGCGTPGGNQTEVKQARTDFALDIPTRFPQAKRLVVIGDIHGDFEAARAALRIAGAIDENNHWIGGDLMVVQLGDILDRGDDALEILDLFDAIAEEALASGGALHLLNGNHELMNVKLDLRYVTVGGYVDFLPGEKRDPEIVTAQEVVDGVGERILAFRPGGTMAMRLADRNVITIVGDNVFVHGGVLPHIVEYGVERLNQETRQWIRGEDSCPPDPLLGRDGPVWSRHYSDDPDEDDCRLLEATLDSLGAKRMVVGHTVQDDGISSACDGRIWRVDVGMAEHYGGDVAVLDLSHGEARILELGAAE